MTERLLNLLIITILLIRSDETMPRGNPDYGNPNYSISQVAFDPSLFLTALKGVNSTDGKGRVWKIDNFNDGLGSWTTDSGGDGVSPVVTTDLPEIGGASVFMNVGTLIGNGQSSLNTAIIITDNPRMGLEAGVYIQGLVGDYIITLDYQETGNSFGAGVKFSVKDKKIYILQNSGYVEVVDLVNYSSDDGWLPIKIVVDFADRKYARLIYGNISLDISSYSLVSTIFTGIGRLIIVIGNIANRANNSRAYIGHTIITLDEP